MISRTLPLLKLQLTPQMVKFPPRMTFSNSWKKKRRTYHPVSQPRNSRSRLHLRELLARSLQSRSMHHTRCLSQGHSCALTSRRTNHLTWLNSKNAHQTMSYPTRRKVTKSAATASSKTRRGWISTMRMTTKSSRLSRSKPGNRTLDSTFSHLT